MKFVRKHAFSSLNSAKILLFFGIPGSGMSTFNGLLCRKFEFNRVSVSEEIRKIKETNDYHIFKPETVNSIRNSLLIGRASDEVLSQIVESKLQESLSQQKGASIDGFPRNWRQMEFFEEKHTLSLAIHLIVERNVLVEGLLGRRVCRKCHKVYNLCHIERHGYRLLPILPKKNGVCDSCGTGLKARAEDNIQTIVKRIEKYEKFYDKLFEHIYKCHKVVDFVPKNGVQDFELLQKMVQDALF